ncbi:hypothetical protein [Mycolicibacterium conceptionense]|uniref:hypothetical protein n=1 Tax=Mycolicibacterium conceptionense TaxID=451644 RepID=UPI001042621C|nr:hypothetical protein [Mycolicibacterium conceptionense]
MIAAKADVQHGEWLPMLKQIGISEAEASRLRSIAVKVSNLPSLEALPTSVSALYELSRLPAEDIEDGIANGELEPVSHRAISAISTRPGINAHI